MFSKLFIGGHYELKRPVNVVDNSLVQRMQEAGRRLRAEGKDVTPVIGRRRKDAPAPAGIFDMLRDGGLSAESCADWPLPAANEPSFDQTYRASNS
jgi:hypothetical protein